MQEIIKVYGKFLISAIVVVLLLAILFGTITDENGNRGIFKIVGAHLDTGAQEKWNYREFENLQAENLKPAPEISFNGSREITVGSILLTNYLTAADCEGNFLPVKIIEVRNPLGEDITGNYQSDSEDLLLPVEGIYTIKVSAVDACNKKTVVQIKIPVNK